ncbi:MAG: hypothetical protein ACP5JG_17405 [Anaerolineae bacterium]
MRERRIVLLVVGGMIMLGAMGFGLGWLSHALFVALSPSDGGSPVGLATETPDSSGQTTPSLAAIPSPTPNLATPETPKLTSTPRPKPSRSPIEFLFEVIQSDAGLYDVCRRYCEGRWPDGEVPGELHDYAREVAAHNDIPWQDGSPPIRVGRELNMLPCPED